MTSTNTNYRRSNQRAREDWREIHEALVSLAHAIANRAALQASRVDILCGWCRRVVPETSPPVERMDLCDRCAKVVAL
jgi:hypothetical protein